MTELTHIMLVKCSSSIFCSPRLSSHISLEFFCCTFSRAVFFCLVILLTRETFHKRKYRSSGGGSAATFAQGYSPCPGQITQKAWGERQELGTGRMVREQEKLSKKKRGKKDWIVARQPRNLPPSTSSLPAACPAPTPPLQKPPLAFLSLFFPVLSFLSPSRVQHASFSLTKYKKPLFRVVSSPVS